MKHWTTPLLIAAVLVAVSLLPWVIVQKKRAADSDAHKLYDIEKRAVDAMEADQRHIDGLRRERNMFLNDWQQEMKRRGELSAERDVCLKALEVLGLEPMICKTNDGPETVSIDRLLPYGWTKWSATNDLSRVIRAELDREQREARKRLDEAVKELFGPWTVEAVMHGQVVCVLSNVVQVVPDHQKGEPGCNLVRYVRGGKTNEFHGWLCEIRDAGTKRVLASGPTEAQWQAEARRVEAAVADAQKEAK